MSRVLICLRNKDIISWLCFSFFLVIMGEGVAKPLELSLKAEAAIVVNADSGAVLYEKKAHEPMYPASTTKLAIALYCCADFMKYLDDDVVATQDCVGWVGAAAKRNSGYSYPAHWLEPGASHAGIKVGERLKVRDLLGLTLVASADDASNCLAYHLGGSVAHYMEGVNGYLKEIGCKNTRFMNPSGLHFPGHVTTAYDLALMARKSLHVPLICEMVRSTKWIRPKSNVQEASVFPQTNRLLRPGPLRDLRCIGIKTGYTSLAGHCLVAAAKKGERTLIAVVLKHKDKTEMFKEITAIFDAAFAEKLEHHSFLPQGIQPYSLKLQGAAGKLSVYTRREVGLAFYPSETPALAVELTWKEDLQLPIAKDSVVGEFALKDANGVVLAREPAFAAASLGSRWWHGWW